MKKIDPCYRSIVSAGLLAALVGCSYRSENYMMGSLSSDHKGVVDRSPDSNLYHFDDPRQKLDGLLETFKQRCLYMLENRNHYTIERITSMHAEFGSKPFQDHQQPCGLMLYRALPSKEATIERLQELKKKLAKLTDWISTGHDSQQAYNYVHLDASPVERFSNECSDYLYRDLLPYWGKIVEWFIFHALDTSIAQGKMGNKQAKEQYQTACKTIQSIYSKKYIEACHASYNTACSKTMESSSHKKDYSPIESITALEKYSLQPIDKMYNDLKNLIDAIEYRDDANLKEEVIRSLKMFYHVAYSVGITDLLSGFSSLLSVYTSSIKYGHALPKIWQEIEKEAIQLLTAQLYLAEFIQENGTSFDQIHSKVRELFAHTSSLLSQHKNNNSYGCRSYSEKG